MKSSTNSAKSTKQRIINRLKKAFYITCVILCCLITNRPRYKKNLSLGKGENYCKKIISEIQ